jgi:hypothetical protein
MMPRNGGLTRGRRRRGRSDLHSPSARQSWLFGASPAPQSLARIGRSNCIGREMDARHRRGPISEGVGPRWLAAPLRRRSLKPPRVTFEIHTNALNAKTWRYSSTTLLRTHKTSALLGLGETSKYGVGTGNLLFSFRKADWCFFEITFPQRSPETENRKTVKIVGFRFPLRESTTNYLNLPQMRDDTRQEIHDRTLSSRKGAQGDGGRRRTHLCSGAAGMGLAAGRRRSDGSTGCHRCHSASVCGIGTRRRCRMT